MKVLVVIAACFVGLSHQQLRNQDQEAANEIVTRRPRPNPTNNPFKAIVKYLGTDFILWAGCPEVDCKKDNRARGGNECEALKRTYTDCIQGEDAPYLGCVKDLLPDGTYLTVPQLAEYCSKDCYLHNKPAQLNRIIRCPYKSTGPNVVVDRFLG